MDMTNGKMSVGWKQIDGKWYHFNSNGHLMTGWILVDSKYYYLNPADGGVMTAGTTLNINGTSYNFDASRRMPECKRRICTDAGWQETSLPEAA